MILVKLCQMTDLAEQSLVVDTRAEIWQTTGDGSIETLPLYRAEKSEQPNERVKMERWLPGATSNVPAEPDGEEIFVVSGSFADAQGIYPKGTWLRQYREEPITRSSTDGCTLWIKQGHLPTKI